MTLDEKISQLHGIRDNEHYRYVPGIPRLGIPPLQITNGPAGAGPGGVTPSHPQAKATALPSPIALASTWDRELAQQYGVVAGRESRDLGNGLLEAPTINIARLPQNGRTFEGYGEDPHLVGELSVANIIGIQSQGIIANVKHYAANNQETDRFVIDEKIDERALREIYLPAFEASIKRGRAASVMCAYPKVNGTFCCEHLELLTNILKKEWRFDGFITSDFGAVHSTVESALAGLDLEMPTGKYWDEELKRAVHDGKVPEQVLDEKLIRRFRTMIAVGVFDHPPTPKALSEKEGGEVARRVAEQGIVLLKNAGNLLPLRTKGLRSIALIGPEAKAAVTGGGGSSRVIPLYTVDPVAGIKSRVGANTEVIFNDGTDVVAAAGVAKSADVAIVMVGNRDREGRDQSLQLPNNQDALVEAVLTANPKTVVVLKTGSAVLMPWADHAPAILEAWYPGEEDGNAVASVLFGEVNPSGKLPITFPKSVGDTPASSPEQYPGVNKIAKYTEGILVGYRHYDAKNIEPLFPFGHGLSYTTFEYRDLKLSKRRLLLSPPAPEQLTVEVELMNTGKVTGAEIVQLYVGFPSTDAVPQPPKQLRGFEKVALAPGKKKRVKVKLDGQAFAYWDANSHGWQVAPGKYEIILASSSRLVRLRQPLEIVTETK